MKCYTINPITIPETGKKVTEGDRREWAYCHHHMVDRTSHDCGAYDKDSDCNIGDMHVSVKAAKFSLMSGSKCKDCTTFDEIWERFASTVHSNVFAYITVDYVVYEMNLAEFKEFIYSFCGLTRESKSNGGYAKIKARSESKALLNWLATRAVAA